MPEPRHFFSDDIDLDMAVAQTESDRADIAAAGSEDIF